MGRRATGETKMNASSSRSHAFLTMRYVTMNSKGERAEAMTHLCDLAGSETYGDVGAHASINVGLLALGRWLAYKGQAARAGQSRAQTPPSYY